MIRSFAAEVSVIVIDITLGEHCRSTARAGEKRLVTAQYLVESRKTFEKATYQDKSGIQTELLPQWRND
jgi:hypothetical protein